MPGAPAAAGWRALLALQVAGICWLAFDPRPPALSVTVWDKVQHAFAFAVLSFTASAARWPRTLPAAALALMVFGVFIEVVQTFIPGRSGEWPDVVADAVGIAIGLPLGMAWQRRFRQR